MISERVMQLLSAQERFEALRARALARHAGRLCDLAYANAQDPPTDALRDATAEAARSPRASDFQYTPYGGATTARRLVAEHLRRTHGVEIGFRDVVLTPGAMAALNLVFRARRTGDRDEAIVVTPCWLDYPLYLENHGWVVRAAPLDARMRLDPARIASLLTERTRMVGLSQPCNPTGIAASAAELDALADVLRRAPSEPLLVSDECHRDFAFAGREIPSPLCRYDETCVVYSFGKKLFMQGQRIGFVALSPRMRELDRRRIELERWARISGICTPTAIMQRTLAAAIAHWPPVEVVERRSRLLRRELTRVGYDVPEPDGTFFLYPRVPGDATAFAERLAELGVLVMPAPLFHHHGHVRISVTAPDGAIESCIPSFARALSEAA